MKIKCKICGCEFVPVIEKHYVSRDCGKTGLSETFNHSEEKLYDTFDCPACGCQIIAQERKRNFVAYEPCLEEEEENE